MTTNTREANTARLIEKATELGYHILSITPAWNEISIVDARTHEYTAHVHQHRDLGWAIQTTSYGTHRPEIIQQVIKGYQRAQQMVAELEKYDIAELAPLNPMD
ncbi:hypothetical protein [Trueperella pyogenes]|uniref:hypothetical protein n=1 Tax=Trueperella pyogenes TaxID=1661 RepID=UPI000D52B927|nr:hypothetical protein [Trueperella pyogenes]AWG03419.1 hypothetical protein DC090_02595 [Trueperella pyogenes]AWG16150.1 hypothetical protein DDE06_04520 [Trueperella pyogenes]AZR05033.1 hypothetical protein EBQ11_07125 [Trueperella pyogenes]